ncbi:MAG: nitrite reductase (NAD(P)H) small subunit [Acidimicrobiaceae bacterium]|nr:nitrite reductase (NAD(P)H) small subunit [Acidimicrobiaceae bacterium]
MSWTDVIAVDRLTVDRGVAALVDGDAVAVFRLGNDDIVAIDHVDPFTGVGVLARGLVGSVGDRDVVVSPLHKQRFDLRTGECLDDPTRSVRTWSVSVADGTVRVAPPTPQRESAA